jgi:iduronate 2-sulfatase
MRIFTSRLLSLVVFAAAPLTAAPTTNRLNVLFLAVDDLRPEFGAYGASHIRSPNLDRLARAGITFNRAYCQQAVCSPSRTVVMTGARPDTTKVWDLETHFRVAMPHVVTLGQHFKNHGYFVQGMGKIFHGGFDDPPTWSVPWQTPRSGGAYAKPENVALANRPADSPAPKAKKGGKRAARKAARGPRGPAYEAGDVPDNFYTDGKTAELAVATLREIGRKPEPFFLAVGFSKPHLPFVSPKKYWDLYDPAKIALAPNRFRPKDAPDFAIQPGGELRSYHGIPTGSIPDDLACTLRHGYYAAISYVDAQIGKVIDELDRLGLRERTVIVLWGDHGWKLGEHDAWCKHSNCENDTNAPLLLAAPGLRSPGVRTNALVEFVDIYPTEALDAKQARDALVAVDALDRLAQQRGDAEHRHGQPWVLIGVEFVVISSSITPALQPLDRHVVENAMAHGGADAARPVLAQDLRRGGQGAGGLGDVVDQQDIAARDIADDVDRLDGGRALALLRHERQARPEDVGIGRGHLHATDVRRADHQLLGLGVARCSKNTGDA